MINKLIFLFLYIRLTKDQFQPLLSMYKDRKVKIAITLSDIRTSYKIARRSDFIEGRFNKILSDLLYKKLLVTFCNKPKICFLFKQCLRRR